MLLCPIDSAGVSFDTYQQGNVQKNKTRAVDVDTGRARGHAFNTKLRTIYHTIHPVNTTSSNLNMSSVSRRADARPITTVKNQRAAITKPTDILP